MKEKLLKIKKISDELFKDDYFLNSIKTASNSIIKSLKNENGKILICGNGGSATQASHMVGEMVGRFSFNRPALPAISLFDLASTTAISNDYGYDNIFSRFVDGLGKEGDILFSLSTSGNSKNCLKAIESAKKKGMKNISLLGKDGGEMKLVTNCSIVVPNSNTPTIQEIHLMIIHHICETVENYFFKRKNQ